MLVPIGKIDHVKASRSYFNTPYDDQVAIGGSRFCLVHSKTDIFTRIDGKTTLATVGCQNIDATTTTTTLTTGEWENGVELNRAIVESLQKL